MNVTELARRLKIPPQELRETLPKMGFDFGGKAVKIPDHVAYKIMREWDHLMKKFFPAQVKKLEEKIISEPHEIQEIKIPKIITVKDFAAKMNTPVVKVLEKLMANGIFVSLNERIDFDTASIIADDFHFKVLEDTATRIEESDDEKKLASILEGEKKSALKKRPPVVVIMGHVDHGKTSLLDAIRKTNVASGEAGGITQHIGAYQAEKNRKKITFIDTPGHEAFTAMRSRGAKVADIAILVVAADDSIKPQTVEAIKIIEQAKLPLIVAINKIDKPDANIDKVKQDLAQMNLIPEDWGGNTVIVLVSALKGTGIPELLDMILLVADLHKNDIRANPKRNALGTIIESRVNKNIGAVATAVIQAGTLHIGDSLVVQNALAGKVRAMEDWNGKSVDEAAPSMPIRIIGFKIAPKVGDILEATEDTKGLKKQTKRFEKQAVVVIKKEEGETKKETINIVLKTDVLGSLEAIMESLEKIHHPDISVKIISKGLGNISENNVLEAQTADALLLAFNVKTAQGAEKLAKEKNIPVRFHKIIYHLIDEVKKEMQKKLSPQVIRTIVGKMKILSIFRTEKDMQIFGGKILEGKAMEKAKIDIYKNENFKASGEIFQLQAGKEKVREVSAGQSCGIEYRGPAIVEAEDTGVIYTEESKEQTIV